MRKYVIAGIAILVFFLLPAWVVWADTTEEHTVLQADTTQEHTLLGENDTTLDDTLLQDADFTEVDQMLEETLEEEVSFEQLVRDLISGKLPLNKETFVDMLERTLFQEIKANGKSMVYVLLLAFLSAALTNFTKVFVGSQTADISFYIVYLLLLAVLISSFKTVNSVAEMVLGQMTEFMKLLMPTYMLTIAAAKGATTATVFYEFLFVLIYAVNFVLFRILLPLCNIYVILSLVNYISREDMLSKTADLIKSVIGWGLKTMMAVVIGLNIVQGIITPAVDSFKHTTVHKAISAIPGVGNTMNAVTEAMVGSGMLIKNGVGVGILIILLLICMIPVLKMTVFMLLYRIVAAVIQPICDKRMLDCIYTISEGTRLLLRCITTALVLFFITIAILTVSTTI